MAADNRFEKIEKALKLTATVLMVVSVALFSLNLASRERKIQPEIFGISDTTPAGCLAHAHATRALPVAAHLVAVPAALYAR